MVYAFSLPLIFKKTTQTPILYPACTVQPSAKPSQISYVLYSTLNRYSDFYTIPVYKVPAEILL